MGPGGTRMGSGGCARHSPDHPSMCGHPHWKLKGHWGGGQCGRRAEGVRTYVRSSTRRDTADGIYIYIYCLPPCLQSQTEAVARDERIRLCRDTEMWSNREDTGLEEVLKRQSRSRETAVSKTDVMILPSSAP